MPDMTQQRPEIPAEHGVSATLRPKTTTDVLSPGYGYLNSDSLLSLLSVVIFANLTSSIPQHYSQGVSAVSFFLCVPDHSFISTS